MSHVQLRNARAPDGARSQRYCRQRTAKATTEKKNERSRQVKTRTVTTDEKREGIVRDPQLADPCPICDSTKELAELTPDELKHAIEHELARLEARGVIRRTGSRRRARTGEMQEGFQFVSDRLES